MSKVCGCGFKEACYIHCDHTDPRCPGDAYDMLVSNPDKHHSSSSNVQSEPPINTIEEVVLRALMTAPNNMQEIILNDRPITVFEVQNYKVLTKAISNLITQARDEAENKKAFRDIEIALKTGFYAGQAMARVELEDCHTNWKKWNNNEELQNEQS